MSRLLSSCIAHWQRRQVVYQDREVPLFRPCVEAMAAAVAEVGQPAELVVCDWPAPGHELEPWICEAAGPRLPVRMIIGEGDYTRGGGLQQAAASAAGEWLFFTDCDMLLTPRVLRRGLEVLETGKAFAPYYHREQFPGDPSPKRCHGGKGNLFTTAEHYRQSGGHPVSRKWGGSDTALWRWYRENDLAVHEDAGVFVHLWHERHGRPE